ncbi:MAG: hypothetical protein GQ477_00740 [Nanohaloarchaea archaeon]|nr:hypothetical protein [Candidatus Nanohaloarchaea archaeon]
MGAIDKIESIRYAVGAFQRHAQMVRDVRDGLSEINDTEKDKYLPVLDSLSNGIYIIVKEAYEHGASLSPDEQKDFYKIKFRLTSVASSLFNLRNGRYNDFEEIYGIITNEKQSSVLPIDSTGLGLIEDAVNTIEGLEGFEREKVIELGDIVLRYIFLALEDIYNPNPDAPSGSDSDFITDRDIVLPGLVDSFKK